MKLSLIVVFLMLAGHLSYAQQFHPFRLNSPAETISIDTTLSFYHIKKPDPFNSHRFQENEKMMRQNEKNKREAIINDKDIRHGVMPNLQPQGLYPLRILYPDTSIKHSLIIKDVEVSMSK